MQTDDRNYKANARARASSPATASARIEKLAKQRARAKRCKSARNKATPNSRQHTRRGARAPTAIDRFLGCSQRDAAQSVGQHDIGDRRWLADGIVTVAQRAKSADGRSFELREARNANAACASSPRRRRLRLREQHDDKRRGGRLAAVAARSRRHRVEQRADESAIRRLQRHLADDRRRRLDKRRLVAFPLALHDARQSGWHRRLAKGARGLRALACRRRDFRVLKALFCSRLKNKPSCQPASHAEKRLLSATQTLILVGESKRLDEPAEQTIIAQLLVDDDNQDGRRSFLHLRSVRQDVQQAKFCEAPRLRTFG